MTLQLYNTMTRKKEGFQPGDPARVTLYVCGPTVYNYAHIGNARPAVVFDVLYRLLQRTYPCVVYARNITDIDDKINKAAEEGGVPFTDITEKFTQIYRDDMAALNVLPPDLEPKVTESMPAIVGMIARLVESGHGYEAEGHVLFQVASFSAYGQLSKRVPEELQAGARVEIAPYKKDPGDFVLWKPSPEGVPGWDSPWGRGRPGWHIECSSMVEQHLGETIDIHGGGHDLVFPHHENEIAQSTCAHHGALYCRVWMHNGFVNVEKEKMSKSIGNVLLVHDLLAQAPGEAIRLALLSAHYRQPLDWTAHSLIQARRTLDGLYGVLRRLQDVDAEQASAPPESFLAVLQNDLNTPQAIAELSALAKAADAAGSPDERARAKGALLAAGWYLGLLGQDPETWFRAAAGDDKVDANKVEGLIAEREAARTARDFARADEIRGTLTQMGVVLEDSAGGTVWRIEGPSGVSDVSND